MHKEKKTSQRYIMPCGSFHINDKAVIAKLSYEELAEILKLLFEERKSEG